MTITLPTIGDLENDVSFELLLGTQTYLMSLMFNERTGRWYYSIAGVQDNLAVGAPCPIPDQGVLVWAESPTGRDLPKLYFISSPPRTRPGS